MEGLIVRGTLSSMAFCNVLFRIRHPWMNSAAARCLCMATPTTSEAAATPLLRKHALLLDRMKNKESRDAAISSGSRPPQTSSSSSSKGAAISKSFEKKMAKGFDELGLGAEVMGALEEMGINVPTEIQCFGIPPVVEGTSVVLASHTGSGKTLAYLLPIVQLLRKDELSMGITMRPRRPRAVVLCPTRELCEQVFRVAKAISHHARFRSVMIGGGGRIGAQKDLLSSPVDMVVGTPGRVLQHILDKHIVYGDIKYLVIDEADMMFDQGFGPDLKKFMGPLKRRASKEGDEGYQTVMVAATMTKAVQRLINDEFHGIKHVQTSTLHKKISSARHSFVILSGNEDKMEALLQILEPSMSKANRVMVFCNTLGSSRAVAHFLTENNIYNVNYHGAVPAQERVENLKKFKAGEGDCPAMVCSDLGSRGLDLDVDHVILFDFPSTSIDYLHRSGRTARMGAKGKVTSLVAKRDRHLAKRIEEAIKRNENLESLTKQGVWRESMMNKVTLMRRSKASSARALLDKKLSKRNPTYSAKTYGRARSRSDWVGPRVRSRPGSGPSERVRPRPRPSPGGEPKEARSRPRPAWAGQSSVKEDERGSRRPKMAEPEGKRKKSSRKSVGSKVPVAGFRGKSSQF